MCLLEQFSTQQHKIIKVMKRVNEELKNHCIYQ